MKKVKMILTNRFDPDPRVYKEAKYLNSIGIQVEILCWDRENEYLERETENVEGINIKRFYPYSKYGSGLKQIGAYFSFKKQVKQYLKNKDYDYIHCHDLDGAVVGCLIKNKKSKMIFDMHEFYEGQGKKQKIKLFIRYIVNYLHDKSDFIIYLNDVQKYSMKRANLEKLIFLPNYPERENYINCEKIRDDKLRISYIGAVRQYDELMNLMNACKEMEDVHISIHGAGVSYFKLKEVEDKYKNVEITGKYHYSESCELYKRTDILYAAYNEHIENWKNAYPIKLFEAIITKTPIIVNKDTALEKIVTENIIGFSVDVGNVEKIKFLINHINKNRYVIAEKEDNLSEMQYNYIWEDVVKNLNNIYC
ncbi:glycosyltransferase [Sedimentibacter sp.]|uniref:glycosyltransferase n=1 Tax=Sedimentibacter sp. TaxID=1960295 RepID=UPI0028ABE12B|nr:glycosyltransferase [Sedimentibacter sp.]